MTAAALTSSARAKADADRDGVHHVDVDVTAGRLVNARRNGRIAVM